MSEVELEIDPAHVTVGNAPILGTEERDAQAIDRLQMAVLAIAPTPADAIRLLLFTVVEIADRSPRDQDVLTAAIAVLRELRDGPPDLDPVLEQAFAELRDMPVPPGPTGDEVIASPVDDVDPEAE